MRVRISEPELVPELIDFLHRRVELVVEELREGEIDVGLIGSFGLEAHELVMELHLRAWQAVHPGVQVEVVREANRQARWLQP